MLSIEDCDLGYLKRVEGKYSFFANASGIKSAKEKYPYDMKLFNLCEAGAVLLDEIPYPYTEYLSCCDRLDIKNKAKILDSDDNFEKLYKIAGLEIERVHFTIKQYKN
jgi:hypothetical protein